MIIYALVVPFLATSLLPLLLVRKRYGLWWSALAALWTIEFLMFVDHHSTLSSGLAALALAAICAIGSRWIVRVGWRSGAFPRE